MAYPSRCLRPEDYTIGWISALPIELAAAVQVLDERHYPFSHDPMDMLYTLGSIGPYRVVMACLPAGQYGTNSAASVAASMRSRFPRLSFCVLVGIGGGVPSHKNDIRLGDIVVSQPNNTSGGVLQYDLGRNTSSGFRRTGSLNAPPEALLRLLSVYQASNMDAGRRDGVLAHLFEPRVTKIPLPATPGPDTLFKADYEHPGESACDNCDPNHVVERHERGIMVHYGTIASGNQVIKTGKVRDQLSQELGGVLCFEMEAAGIMNTFPCLVIRGICDYADSHKNKIWQGYAAVVAALYVKELFSVSSKPFVPQEKYSKSLSIIPKVSFQKKYEARYPETDEWVLSGQALVEQDYYMKHNISQYDPMQTLSRIAKSRCPGTTRWILGHSKYLDWHDNPHSCLWLTGKIGSGKTTITSTVIQQLLEEVKTDVTPTPVLHYFYSHSYPQGLTAIALLSSFIQQLLNFLEAHELQYSPEIDEPLRSCFGRGSVDSDFDEIFEKIFLALMARLDCVTLVVDGLDECEQKEISKALKFLSSRDLPVKIQVFISGRESIDITKSVPGSSTIFVSNSDSVQDIRSYISWRLEEKLRQRYITDNPQLLEDLKCSLLERADQMILWVHLQIENIWEDCYNDAEIRAALADLPKDLNETYGRCVAKIESGQGLYARRYATKIIPWLCDARKPFTMLTLRQALAINSDNGRLNRDLMPSTQDVLRSCANLLTLEAAQADTSDDMRHVLLVHQSLRQFLGATGRSHPFIEDIQQTLDRQCMSLAGLCLKHLLSGDYSLSLEQVKPNVTVRLEPPVLLRLTDHIPGILRPLMPQPKPFIMSLPPSPPVKQKNSDLELPAIFHYARDEWPHLTRHMPQNHRLFASFKALALEPKLTYRVHPWEPLGQSANSHISGLLAWSIVNFHVSMFHLLFTDELSIGPELIKVPIPEYGGFNPVILAVRYDNSWALSRMVAERDKHVRILLLSEDANGWNFLHHAAITGAASIITFLGQEAFVPYKCATGAPKQTPLTMAMSKKDLKTVHAIVKMPAFCKNKLQDTDQAAYIDARNEAIIIGDCVLLEALDMKIMESGLLYNKALSKSSSAVRQAAIAGHGNIISHVVAVASRFIPKGSAIDDFGDTMQPGITWLEQLLLEAIEAHELTLVKHILTDSSETRTRSGRLLRKAVIADDVDGFTTLCQAGLNPDLVDTYEPIIHTAAKNSSGRMLCHCLKWCEDWDIPDWKLDTPLIAAARHGRPANVGILLKARSISANTISIEACNRDHETALYCCTRPIFPVGDTKVSDLLAYAECAELLIKHGAGQQGTGLDNQILRFLKEWSTGAYKTPQIPKPSSIYALSYTSWHGTPEDSLSDFLAAQRRWRLKYRKPALTALDVKIYRRR